MRRFHRIWFWTSATFVEPTGATTIATTNPTVVLPVPSNMRRWPCTGSPGRPANLVAADVSFPAATKFRPAFDLMASGKQFAHHHRGRPRGGCREKNVE